MLEATIESKRMDISTQDLPEVVLERALDGEAELRRKLQKDGYLHLRHWDWPPAELAASFGEVIKVMDVVVDESATSLVKSQEELGAHTDHSRARYILWECRGQCAAGGTSVLVDAGAVLESLSDADRKALRHVYLTEHQVFRNDASRVPLLRTIRGEDRLYYSFWLVEDEVPEESREALERFQNALEAAPRIEIELEPGEILLIDNHRILHGRTAIEAAPSKRHLVRYWISDEVPKVRPSRERRGPLCPERISPAEVKRFVERGVEPAVAALDLSMVKMKMQDADEGKGWTPEQCDEVELEYKRYLTLNLRYPDHAIVPTKEMDQMWHYHILDTRAYHADCDEVFGEYFHHFPYFGMRSDDDEADLDSAFEETCALYRAEFGEELMRAAGAQDCWHDCQGRCWNACKSD